MQRCSRAAILFLTVLCPAGAGHADQLDRAVFSAATLHVSNGSFQLSGTLAEAGVVGATGGAAYSFRLGFWAPSVLAVTGAAPWTDAIVLADRLDSAFPNPFRQQATIRFALARPAAVRLSIYDVGGRRVATLIEGPLLAGEHRRVWDGRDDAGRVVAGGAYFYRLEAGSWRAAGRVLKLR